jgi:hypothetical protein
MKFKYTAMDSTGRETEGVVEAEDQSDAIQQIRNKGYFPTRVNETDDDAKVAQVKEDQSLLGSLLSKAEGVFRPDDAPAQEVPEEIALMKDAMGAAIPIMEETMKTLAESKTFPKYVAKYARNLYEALQEEGFDGDQAVQIVAACFRNK